jgi:hypothetical protein
MAMKRDNAQVRWDCMEARLNKMMEELSKRMDAHGEATGKRCTARLIGTCAALPKSRTL